MRGLTALVLAVCTVFSVGAAEYSISMSPPATGLDLLKALQRQEQSLKNSRGAQALADTVMAKGYVAGVANALGESTICPPGKRFGDDFYIAVTSYLEQHAAALNGPPYPLVKQALMSAYPCK